MQTNYSGSPWPDIDTDEWILCDRCRYPMRPLYDFEIQSIAEFPAIEADGMTFFLFGWTIFVVQVIFRFLVGLFTFAGRKKKLAQLKAELLPRFPNSLVCPQCLETVRRP